MQLKADQGNIEQEEIFVDSNYLTNGRKNGSAVIVGASLSGLMAGIALAREGIQVTIFEKAKEGQRTGAGLQVDGEAFGDSETARLLRKLASGGKSSIQLWTTIESRLRKEARSIPNMDFRYDTRVKSVGQDAESAWIETDEGKTFHGDILIGADGHYSMVRRYIAPEHPDAKFAGYMVWIASIDEGELPEDERPGRHLPQVSMLGSYGGFMFGSIMDQEDISTESGTRRIGCTWYDNSHNDVLRRLGCVKGNVVHHSLAGKDIPEDTLRELANHASDRWPEPWSFSMLHALQTRNITGIPIKEYVPKRLADGRIALVGDAAHVPAPITASGFNASLQDAADLGKCAAKGLQGKSAVKVLKKYESMRLKKVQRIVQSGQSFSYSFGR